MTPGRVCHHSLKATSLASHMPTRASPVLGGEQAGWGAASPPQSELLAGRDSTGSPSMLTSTSWHRDGETAQPTPKERQKDSECPLSALGSPKPLLLAPAHGDGHSVPAGYPDLPRCPTLPSPAPNTISTHNQDAPPPLERLNLPPLPGKGKEQGGMGRRKLPRSPAWPTSLWVTALALPPQFFTTERRGSRASWMSLLVETELLPGGPKSILGAGGAMGLNASQQAAWLAPWDALGWIL